MNSKPRILVISHGHPDFSLGGGEIAAYQLFKAYRESPEVEDAWFLARKDNPHWPSGAISVRRDHEFMWDQAVHDWINHKSVHRDSLTRGGFPELVRALQPTIVHLHHYAHLGLDILVMLRRLLPNAQLMLTLHEYMAICRHNGQMVKTSGMTLCNQSSPADCARCYPDSTEEDFWLRREFIMDRFRLVDGFVAPSEFLRQRYIAWGLPADRIVVIENGQPDLDILPSRPLLEGQTRNRFAYFGQINPYKGLDVVLKALNQLPRYDQKKLVVEIHAAHFERQPVELRERIAGLLEPLTQQGVVQWIGPYRPEDMRRRLAGVDWTLVPSVWWENSPMVIQEALGAGRPVICSDIGGMAEKVHHDVDGLHVPVGNAVAWASTLLRAGTEPGLWDRLSNGIRPVLTHQRCVEAHLSFFEQLHGVHEVTD